VLGSAGGKEGGEEWVDVEVTGCEGPAGCLEGRGGEEAEEGG
jgi:hypothetical protein